MDDDDCDEDNSGPGNADDRDDDDDDNSGPGNADDDDDDDDGTSSSGPGTSHRNHNRHLRVEHRRSAAGQQRQLRSRIRRRRRPTTIRAADRWRRRGMTPVGRSDDNSAAARATTTDRLHRRDTHATPPRGEHPYDDVARRPRSPCVDGRHDRDCSMSMTLQPATSSGSADARRLAEQRRRRRPRRVGADLPVDLSPAVGLRQPTTSDSDAADDVVSETMTRAVAGIAGFRWTADGMNPWLFGIARRVVADHHRRAGRRRRWSRAVAAPAVALPADVVELAEEHAAVRAAFNRLSADDREVLELRVIAGLSPEQTAAVLGKRPGTIRTAQSRAFARLRKRLGER